MRYFDPLNAKAPFAAQAVISCVVVAFAIAMEVIELWLNGKGLAARLAAYQQLQLTAFDAPYAYCDEYFIPGTDLAPLPGGNIVGCMFDIFNILYLGTIFIEEIPTRYFMPAFVIFLRPFGNDVGPWAVGFYLAIIGSGILAVPPPAGVVGNDTISTLRSIAGWALLADGGLLIFIGIIWQRHARWLRNQLQEIPKPEKNKKLAVQQAFEDMKDVLAEMHAEHLPIGPLEYAISEMGDMIDAFLADF